MFNYPVQLTPADEGGFIVTFPDVPEALTQGEDEAEALMRARDALETALEIYVEERRPLPTPSDPRGLPTVSPDALACAKLAVHQTMMEQRVGKAELARRLAWHLPQVDRILDLHHASRFDHVEAALAALGKRLEVEIHPC